MTAWYSTSTDPLPVPSGLTAHGAVRPPASKSLTQRFYNLALLSTGPTEVVHPLVADDCEAFLAGVEAAGCRVDRTATTVHILPPPAAPGDAAAPGPVVEIDCRGSGTMLRFLTASLAAIPGRWRIDGAPRLRERPMAALLTALSSLEASIEPLARPDSAPLLVAGGSLAGGTTAIAAGESSQYVSALLMAGVAAPRGITLEIEELVSTPYVGLTIGALERFGIEVFDWRSGSARVDPGRPGGNRVEVEVDASSACYPAAAAVVTSGEIEIEGLSPESRQGDVHFLDQLERMGARIDWTGDGVRVGRHRKLVAIEADLSNLPDQVPTLAALAPFAEGTTVIRGVPHLRFKESDRLAAMAGELSKLGVPVAERPDGLVIDGCWADREPPSKPVTVGTHGDHRIAMSLALVGLARPGVAIAEPAVVNKSYPGFWRDLEGLLAR